MKKQVKKGNFEVFFISFIIVTLFWMFSVIIVTNFLDFPADAIYIMGSGFSLVAVLSSVPSKSMWKKLKEKKKE